MRTINKKIIFIYGLIIAYILTRILSVKVSFLSIDNYVNIFIWLILFFISYVLTKYDYKRFLDKTDKVQTTFIVVVIYLMLYFLSGLIFGYQYNAYSMTLKGISTNILLFIPIIFFQEYVRQVLVQYSGKKTKWLVLITILFIN